MPRRAWHLAHLSVVMSEQAIGTRMTHVPYKSTGDVVNSMLGGNVDLAIDSMTTVWPHAEQGTVRALGVLDAEARRHGARRAGDRRDRQGLRGDRLAGPFAPAGVPKPVVEKIAAEAKRVWNLPEVKKNLGTSAPTRCCPRALTPSPPSPAPSAPNGPRW